MNRVQPIELTNMCMLRREDGCVLVQNRRKGNWDGLTFPGGHVEAGESLVESVVREMREETGLTIRHPRLVGAKNWMQDDGSRYIVLMYTASEYEGELHASEEGDVRWMTLEQLRAGPMADGMELYLDVYLSEHLSEIWYERGAQSEWIAILK